MKIDEIITEAPWDGIKNAVGKVAKGIQGAKQGYAASQMQRKAAAEAERIGKQVYDRWVAQSGRLQAAGQPLDANTLKQWLTTFLKGMPLTADPPAQLNNPRQVLGYITQQTAAYMARKEQGAAAEPVAQQPTTQQQIPTAQQPIVNQPKLGVTVPPGERLVITAPSTGGKYFKTQAGWTNELGQKITDETAIQKLERFADAGGAKMEKLPPQQPVQNKGPQVRRKGKR